MITINIHVFELNDAIWSHELMTKFANVKYGNFNWAASADGSPTSAKATVAKCTSNQSTLIPLYVLS